MTQNQQEILTIKQHQLQKIFQEIDDELTILAATAKFNHTTCKTDANHLKLTLAYIEDTTQLVNLLKNRLTLLIQTTS
ncbi:MAG: hypothetical protein NWE96_09685 [Candidatus Bathyarchaeota archaeon]|nr:hypothetical protein [Candidatus Bathyarchaeota archaeon]